LARIYFSIYPGKVERTEGEEKKKHFLLPTAGNGNKDSKWWFLSVALYFTELG
jgi:hypothetical protein